MSAHFVFTIDGQNYGLPLGVVEEAVNLPWIDRVAESPRDVCGVFDLRGAVLPVVDPAYRLGAELRPARVSDVLVIARSDAGRVALRVDAIVGLQDGESTPLPLTAEGPPFVTGLLRGEGLVTLVSLDAFLLPAVRAFVERQAAEARAP
ncbi:MAG: chemotaxis protein CheW [Archangium sp.]|nr:chemotaxis protein CheW [Archangium sp.]MDP3153524.1 chemotaxis protein CheW [Archangium sp.]MDP3574552.1 chemotaxis protein CheW [Archangium sp.]